MKRDAFYVSLLLAARPSLHVRVPSMVGVLFLFIRASTFLTSLGVGVLLVFAKFN